MKILHVSHSDLRGGANIAAYQIHKSLLNNNQSSKFLCYEKLSNESDVITIPKNFFKNKLHQYKLGFERKIIKTFINDRHNSYSTGFFGGGLVNLINFFNSDIVNLHWINNSMISISDISKIKSKIVWTLHDMWPLCGAEHYTTTADYQNGYSDFKSFNLNKYIWNIKKKHFRDSINIICPSNWIYEHTTKSKLFANSSKIKIPYALDVKKWKCLDKKISKKLLDIDISEKVILFGSERGSEIKRKNYNFLITALNKMDKKNNIRLLVFGGNKQEELKLSNSLKISFLGHIYDKENLNSIYSSADLLAVPSTQETFGLVAAESLLSGTPCIAFKNTGLEEIIDHKENGYLAEYMDTKDFEAGINWLLINNANNELTKASVKNTVNKFNFSVISNQYINYYKSIMEKK